MTSRLLHLTFGGGDFDEQRLAMRRRRRGRIVQSGAHELFVGAVPLVKLVDGVERQAIRVECESASGDLQVSVRGAGAGTAVSGSLAGPGWLDLWVPVVAAESAFAISVDGVDCGEVQVPVVPRWTVHVVHHSHLDIGYTDPQGIVLRNHLAYLDQALQLVDATAHLPEAARFRWTVESSYSASRWLAQRSPERVARFVESVRAGDIEVTALPFQLHTEACSTEEIWRQARTAVELGKVLGRPIDSAMHTDVPGAVSGLVDALAAAGVRYLSAAHNWAGRSVPYLHGGDQLTRPFWWTSASGRRLLTWHTDTAHGLAYMEGNLVGLVDGWDRVEQLLPAYLDALTQRDAPYGPEAFGWSGHPDDAAADRPAYSWDVLHLRVQGAHADNAGPSRMPSDMVAKWNETYVSPRLRCSTSRDFFLDIESRHGEEFAEHSGDWSDWWADGLGSAARELGWNRRAQSTLRAAESVHAWADVRSGSGASPTEALEDAYLKVALFDEHTWGAANPWGDEEEGFSSGARQWVWKGSLAQHAMDAADDLLDSGIQRLAGTWSSAVPAGSDSASGGGTGLGVLVVNTGPAGRTDVARVFVPASLVPLDLAVRVRDCRSGELVPCDCVERNPVATPTRPAGRELRFVARDMPSVGFVRFELIAGEPASANALTREVGVVRLESETFAVTVDTDRGTLSSVLHKPSGRELVNQDSVAGMNELVHEVYATAPHINHLSGHLSAKGTELLAQRAIAGPAHVVEAVRTETVDRVVLDRTASGSMRLRTTIEVPHEVERVDITNTVWREGTAAKESLYFAFPLAASGPKVWELTGAVGGTDVPHVPGGANHMQFLRHWLCLEDPDLTIGWATGEAPLVQLGALHVPYAPFPKSLDPSPAEPGLVFSWAMNNIWDTNFPSQQAGECTFRYALGAGVGQPAEVVGPAVAAGLTDALVGTVGRLSGPASGVLARSLDPGVIVTSLGRSQDGTGLVVRLRSLVREHRVVTLELPGYRGAEVQVASGHEQDPVTVDVVDETVTVEVRALDLVSVICPTQPLQ
jgi:hypothetical protein